jgi:ribose-phosphate pyrophosphokinase
MKTLNLVYPEKSDIKYKKISFPDGQQQVIIYNQLFVYGPITIKSRLNNFQDLELIVCATKSLRNFKVKEIHLYTPYFLGSRSDRQFEEGSCNYLKDVICPIINSLEFESVTVIDPHSDVLEACLNNFKKIDNSRLFTVAHYDIDLPFNSFVLVSPDAGASKKIYKIAEQIGYKGDIITCSKDRDNNGKLTKTIVPLTESCFNKDFIIIDDICDGGQTFINIAKVIKDTFDKYGDGRKCGKIYLIVTHAIFSKGIDELYQYFDGIYCTNSYGQLYVTNNPFNPTYDLLIEDEWVGPYEHQYYKNIPKNFINQLNVF